MKISRTKFVIAFLIFAFIFQMITNSVLGPEIRLFPADGEWYPGTTSSIGWKNSLASIIHPLKWVFIQPLSFLGQDPDPAPPVLVFAFAIYWTLLALSIYFLFSKLFTRKRT